jgi:hypothetical protein
MDIVVSPATIFATMARYRMSPTEKTMEFESLRHNKDLCPTFHQHAERLLASFNKYTSISYDIQGPRDRGSDILIRYGDAESIHNNTRFVALQVKSFEECEKDKKIVGRIKSQIYETETEYDQRLERYYLLLCTNQLKHVDRVRAICAELKNDTLVDVVVPQYALTLFKMAEATIDSIADRMLYPEDFVRKKARNEIAGIGRCQLELLITCLVDSIEHRGDFKVAESVILHTRLGVLNDEPCETAESLSKLEGEFLDADHDKSEYRFRRDSLAGVIALYYDSLVRFEHSGAAAVGYLYSFLEKDAEDEEIDE